MTQAMTTGIPSPDLDADMREIEAELLREVENLVMEDDTPVDNIFSEKEQRLLVDALYGSWEGPVDEQGQRGKFTALANVGLFPAIHQPPLVPDVLLSLNVTPRDQQQKRNRSYLLWEFGKLPEVVIEIVSNQKGEELGAKLLDYAKINIPYYVVHDPLLQLGDEPLRIFELIGGRYTRRESSFLPLVQLGFTLWEGEYQDMSALWLRWCDADGNLLLTGAERAERETERADREAERSRALAEKLRELGVDPDKI
jgi:Uma2 family endonuclease